MPSVNRESSGGSRVRRSRIRPSSMARMTLGLLFVPMLATATDGVADQDFGIASGLLAASQQVGGAVGIAVLVVVASHRTADLAATGDAPGAAFAGGLQAAFAVIAAIMLVSSLLGLLVARSIRPAPTPTPTAAAPTTAPIV